jgi:hypothetical protein
MRGFARRRCAGQRDGNVYTQTRQMALGVPFILVSQHCPELSYAARRASKLGLQIYPGKDLRDQRKTPIRHLSQI